MQTPENVAPNAEVSFGAISEAVEQFKSNAGTWVVAAVVTGVIMIVLSMIMNTFVFASMRSSIPMPVPGAPGMPPVMPTPHINFPLILIISLISLVINSLLGAGLFRMATKQMRGQAIAIGDLFDFADVAAQAIIAGILVALMIYVGTILCILPGLVLSGLLMFTFPLIVDKQMSAMEAISSSINALKGQWLMAAVFAFVVGILYSIGVLFCLVGVLVTAPVALLSITVLYRNFFIGPNSPPSAGETFEPAIPPGG